MERCSHWLVVGFKLKSHLLAWKNVENIASFLLTCVTISILAQLLVILDPVMTIIPFQSCEVSKLWTDSKPDSEKLSIWCFLLNVIFLDLVSYQHQVSLAFDVFKMFLQATTISHFITWQSVMQSLLRDTALKPLAPCYIKPVATVISSLWPVISSQRPPPSTYDILYGFFHGRHKDNEQQREQSGVSTGRRHAWNLLNIDQSVPRMMLILIDRFRIKMLMMRKSWWLSIYVYTCTQCTSPRWK